MLKGMDEYLKKVNQELLNPRGLRISHYRYFYFLELRFDPQLYFKDRSNLENYEALRKEKKLMFGKQYELKDIIKDFYAKKKNEIEKAQENIIEFDKNIPILL